MYGDEGVSISTFNDNENENSQLELAFYPTSTCSKLTIKNTKTTSQICQKFNIKDTRATSMSSS